MPTMVLTNQDDDDSISLPPSHGATGRSGGAAHRNGDINRDIPSDDSSDVSSTTGELQRLKDKLILLRQQLETDSSTSPCASPQYSQNRKTHNTQAQTQAANDEEDNHGDSNSNGSDSDQQNPPRKDLTSQLLASSDSSQSSNEEESIDLAEKYKISRPSIALEGSTTTTSKHGVSKSQLHSTSDSKRCPSTVQQALISVQRDQEERELHRSAPAHPQGNNTQVTPNTSGSGSTVNSSSASEPHQDAASSSSSSMQMQMLLPFGSSTSSSSSSSSSIPYVQSISYQCATSTTLPRTRLIQPIRGKSSVNQTAATKSAMSAKPSSNQGKHCSSPAHERPQKRPLQTSDVTNLPEKTDVPSPKKPIRNPYRLRKTPLPGGPAPPSHDIKASHERPHDKSKPVPAEEVAPFIYDTQFSDDENDLFFKESLDEHPSEGEYQHMPLDDAGTAVDGVQADGPKQRSGPEHIIDTTPKASPEKSAESHRNNDHRNDDGGEKHSIELNPSSTHAPVVDGSVQASATLPNRDEPPRRRDTSGNISQTDPTSTRGKKPKPVRTFRSANSPSTKASIIPVSEMSSSVVVVPEIQHHHYAPTPHRPGLQPRLLTFSEANRPVQDRTRCSISDFFGIPFDKLWKGRFSVFNHMQTEMANLLCHSDDHVVVAAPTGAGKTVLFEMAMIRLLSIDLEFQGRLMMQSNRIAPNSMVQPNSMSRQRKIVYISPSKALCEERFEDWSKRFAAINVGVKVSVITGDADGESFRTFAESHIILTTPEKLDSMTRNWTTRFLLFACIKLVLLDEVHLLGDENRGATLECIIVRMKTIQRAISSFQFGKEHLSTPSFAQHQHMQAMSFPMRIVAVSATLPNLQDIAELIGANEAYEFDSSYRPVPLDVHVWGAGRKGKNEFFFWNSLDQCVLNIIHKFSEGKQTLIFCHTKKECERLASFLSMGGRGQQFRGNKFAKIRTLNECMSKRVAYHHAGLDAQTRKFIEKDFAAGRLKWLCATSTLSMGVNLPARLVVIKGTMTWRGGSSGYQEIDPGTILQMIGRAGRPGLDTKGVAVVVTDDQSRDRIEGLAAGLGAAQSRLLPKIVQAINVEISQRVIVDLRSCFHWVQSTLLFVNLRQQSSEAEIDDKVMDVCKSAFRMLQGINAISLDKAGDLVRVNPASYIMSQKMVTLQMMERIHALPADATECQLMHVLARDEAIDFPVRRHEKKFLNEKHKELRFKINTGPLSKFRVKEPWEKAFILIQCYISQFEFNDFTLSQEMSSTCNKAMQVLEATLQHSVHASKHGDIAYQCLRLTRAISTCVWGDNSNVLYQFPMVNQEKAGKLRFNGIATFDDVVKSSDAVIGKAVGQPARFGRELRGHVISALQSGLSIKARVERTKESNRPTDVFCDLVRDSDVPFGAEIAMIPKKTHSITFTLLVYADHPGSLIFFEDNVSGPKHFRFECPTKFHKLYIRLLASLVGLDKVFEVSGDCSVDGITVDANTPRTLEAQGNSAPNSKHCDRRSSNHHQTPSQQKQRDIRGVVKSTSTKTPSKRATKATPRCRKASVKVPTVAASMTTSRMEKGILRNIGTQAQASSERMARVMADAQHNVQTQEAAKKSITPRMIEGADKSIARGPASSQRLHQHSQHGRSPTRFGLAGSTLQNADTREQAGTPASAPRPSDARPAFIDIPNSQASPMSQMSPTSSSLQSSVARSRSRPDWGRAKREMQRKQTRAFSSKKDNPFTHYKHDPNDAEGLLESLSHDDDVKQSAPSSQRQPISSSCSFQRPQYIRQGRSVSPRSVHRPFSRSRQFVKRRRVAEPSLSTPQLLRQKAAEQEAYRLEYANRHAAPWQSQQSNQPLRLPQHRGGFVPSSQTHRLAPFVNTQNTTGLAASQNWSPSMSIQQPMIPTMMMASQQPDQQHRHQPYQSQQYHYLQQPQQFVPPQSSQFARFRQMQRPQFPGRHQGYVGRPQSTARTRAPRMLRPASISTQIMAQQGYLRPAATAAASSSSVPYRTVPAQLGGVPATTNPYDAQPYHEFEGVGSTGMLPVPAVEAPMEQPHFAASTYGNAYEPSQTHTVTPYFDMPMGEGEHGEGGEEMADFDPRASINMPFASQPPPSAPPQQDNRSFDGAFM